MFRVDGLRPELWHPDSGRRETVAVYQKGNAQTSLPIHFDPSGSVFVVFREPPTREAIVAVSRNDARILPPPAPVEDATVVPPAMVEGKITMTVWKAGQYSFTTARGKRQTASVDKIPESMPLAGPWNLHFPEKLGAPSSAIFKKLISWPDSDNEGIKHFSGTATYANTFAVSPDWLRSDTWIYLDLGEVRNLALVRLNGKLLEILWKPPFRVEVTSALRKGENQIEITVTNLWPNRLIGDKKLPRDQRVT